MNQSSSSGSQAVESNYSFDVLRWEPSTAGEMPPTAVWNTAFVDGRYSGFFMLRWRGPEKQFELHAVDAPAPRTAPETPVWDQGPGAAEQSSSSDFAHESQWKVKLGAIHQCVHHCIHHPLTVRLLEDGSEVDPLSPFVLRSMWKFTLFGPVGISLRLKDNKLLFMVLRSEEEALRLKHLVELHFPRIAVTSVRRKTDKEHPYDAEDNTFHKTKCEKPTAPAKVRWCGSEKTDFERFYIQKATGGKTSHLRKHPCVSLCRNKFRWWQAVKVSLGFSSKPTTVLDLDGALIYSAPQQNHFRIELKGEGNPIARSADVITSSVSERTRWLDWFEAHGVKLMLLRNHKTTSPLSVAANDDTSLDRAPSPRVMAKETVSCSTLTARPPQRDEGTNTPFTVAGDVSASRHRIRSSAPPPPAERRSYPRRYGPSSVELEYSRSPPSRAVPTSEPCSASFSSSSMSTSSHSETADDSGSDTHRSDYDRRVPRCASALRETREERCRPPRSEVGTKPVESRPPHFDKDDTDTEVEKDSLEASIFSERQHFIDPYCGSRATNSISSASPSSSISDDFANVVEGSNNPSVYLNDTSSSFNTSVRSEREEDRTFFSDDVVNELSSVEPVELRNVPPTQETAEQISFPPPASSIPVVAEVGSATLVPVARTIKEDESEVPLLTLPSHGKAVAETEVKKQGSTQPELVSFFCSEASSTSSFELRDIVRLETERYDVAEEELQEAEEEGEKEGSSTAGETFFGSVSFLTNGKKETEEEYQPQELVEAEIMRRASREETGPLHGRLEEESTSPSQFSEGTEFSRFLAPPPPVTAWTFALPLMDSSLHHHQYPLPLVQGRAEEDLLWVCACNPVSKATKAMEEVAKLGGQCRVSPPIAPEPEVTEMDTMTHHRMVLDALLKGKPEKLLTTRAPFTLGKENYDTSHCVDGQKNRWIAKPQAGSAKRLKGLLSRSEINTCE